MAPVTNKAKLEVDPKRTTGITNSSNDDDSDEGFVSPSVQRIGLKRGNTQSRNSESSSSCGSDNDSQIDSSSSTSSSPPSSLEITEENIKEKTSEGAAPTTPPETASPPPPTSTAAKVAAEKKSEELSEFIVNVYLGKSNGESSDKVERTLLRCVRMMTTKHEILFKGMMKRMDITKETTYICFETVANTLFEDEKMVITWSRIVALYAFGAKLAVHCKEKGMEDLARMVPSFLAKFSKEVLTPFVVSIGGWNKICDEFPEECDIESKIRRVLSWTAVGLGVAATVSYLTSR